MRKKKALALLMSAVMLMGAFKQNNKDRLDGEPLSDSEFEQVKNQLQFSTFYKAESGW